MNSIKEVTVSVFNSPDLDYIEPIENIGVIFANPEEVESGVTDRSGIYRANLSVGKYFLSLLDPVLSESTGQNIPYLLDYPITVAEEGSLFIKIEIDSSQVESETDIPDKLNVAVRVISQI